MTPTFIAMAIGVTFLLTGTAATAAYLSSKEMSIMAKLKLPPRLDRWRQQIIRAANQTVPQGMDASAWAALIAAIIDRESAGGDSLNPPGAYGTGDTAPRWRMDSPLIAMLASGRTKPYVDGRLLWELNPPLACGAIVAGWGYGLGQHDYEFGNRSLIDSGKWMDPQTNINATAMLLANLYTQANGDLKKTAAAYNAGAKAFTVTDPDSVTTKKNYASDVLARQRSYLV
jgi:hypothetical protein